jgi:hypothetical protein
MYWAGVALLIGAWCVLSFGPVQAVPYSYINDQSFTFGGAGEWYLNNLWNTRGAAQVGQEFTPSLPGLNVVNLAPITCTGCGPQWLWVRIRESSLRGRVVGMSTPVQLNALNNSSHTTFRFPFLVHLQPGMRYVIEVVPLIGRQNAILWYGESGMDFYPDGRAIVQSQPNPGADIWFEEGIIPAVPRLRAECLFNGWQLLVRADNTRFSGQQDCMRSVRYSW